MTSTSVPVAKRATDEKDEVEIASQDSNDWVTSRKELWSFYLYYVGNNGLSGFNFGPSQFQNLLYLAGYDPTQPPFTTPCGDGDCVLPYLGKVRDSKHTYASCYAHHILTQVDH